MKFLKLVTITGADDGTNIKELIALAKEFPYVEFGILLSGKQSGHRRFPSNPWLNELVHEAEGKKLNFAGHLCGTWVREFLVGKWPRDSFWAIHPKLHELFKRWQINTHGYPHKVKPQELIYLVQERSQHDQTIIFQYDNVNRSGLEVCQEAGCRNIATLFDLSHGAGVLPAGWRIPLPNVDCGYAGGLSPENVAEQLALIEKKTDGVHIWIDAETRLRSDDDVTFDLGKCRAFLEASRPFVL